MVCKDGENILTVDDAILEDDAFEWSYGWDEDCLVRLSCDIQDEMSKGKVYGHFC